MPMCKTPVGSATFIKGGRHKLLRLKDGVGGRRTASVQPPATRVSIYKSILTFKMSSTSKSKRSAAGRLEHDVGLRLLFSFQRASYKLFSTGNPYVY
jgi:hypothetical protein